MQRIERTPAAEADAQSVWLYIAKDKPDAATKLLFKIEERLIYLAAMPLSAAAVPWIALDVRRASVGNYVIYYKALDDGIWVLRILHGARQPEDLL
jgi:toxin ParE1/3/4